PRWDACSTRRGMLPLISMAASAAFSSARADATGSTMPAGTTVRAWPAVRTSTGPLFGSEIVMSGLLHETYVGRHGLPRVVALDDLAEARHAEQGEDRDRHQQESEDGESREPRGPPGREPDDREREQHGNRPEQQVQHDDEPQAADPGILRGSRHPRLRRGDLRGDEIAHQLGQVSEQSQQAVIGAVAVSACHVTRPLLSTSSLPIRTWPSTNPGSWSRLPSWRPWSAWLPPRRPSPCGRHRPRRAWSHPPRSAGAGRGCRARTRP